MAKSIRKRIDAFRFIQVLTVIVFFISSCAVQKAQKTLLNTPALKGAHVGIAVYNDSKSTWVDKHQSDYYYTPASNVKILATYVGLAFLGDSLPGWKIAENADSLFLFPQGDPSFMHPEFAYQPVLDLIKKTNKQVMIATTQSNDRFESMGDGWAWNDYAEDYQPERSRMPVYGNVVHFYNKGNTLAIKPFYFFKQQSIDYDAVKAKQWSRKKNTNDFFVNTQKNNATYFQVPFVHDPSGIIEVLNDSLQLNKPIQALQYTPSLTQKTIKTIPTDSLLKIMMSRSDNFYAEQVVLMGSAQLLGKMDDGAFIDSLQKTELNNLPQSMRWADGSGLSRYNLNSPENYITILKEMHSKFGEARVKNIFEKGGEGTLAAYYKNFPGTVYAKTGTLGGQIALSGFIYTQKNQKLYFSVLVANHMSKTTAAVRRAVEAYLVKLAKLN
jgi:D-alanyl-D-alanine carboxypeptidase/D-alanyl-D-alanine-endopeptidase (penicillin-binding protein 4)